MTELTIMIVGLLVIIAAGRFTKALLAAMNGAREQLSASVVMLQKIHAEQREMAARASSARPDLIGRWAEREDVRHQQRALAAKESR